MGKINYYAVFMTALVAFVMYFIWYGLLFQTHWLELHGLSITQAEEMFNPWYYAIYFVLALVMKGFVAWLFMKLNISSIIDGLKMGLGIWFFIVLLGLAITNMMSYNPFGLTLLDGGALSIDWALTGAIIGGWVKS